MTGHESTYNYQSENQKYNLSPSVLGHVYQELNHRSLKKMSNIRNTSRVYPLGRAYAS